MGNLNFFAAEADFRECFKFLFDLQSIRVFESSSRFDTALREFKSIKEICSAFPIGSDEFGNGVGLTFQLHAEEVLDGVDIRRINLNPASCDGATFRYAIEGPGLMQLYLGGLYKETVLTHSHFGYFSEAGAKERGLNQKNWSALKKITGKIEYFLRSKIAAAKAGPCPVLPAALKLHERGVQLKSSAQTFWTYEISRKETS